MSQELIQVQRCPGCDTLHRSSALTHTVQLFQQPWGFREAVVCDECWERINPPAPVVEAPAAPTKRPVNKSRSKVTE
jgi:hypothetical protein